jgi:hypothetical protein
MVWRALLAGTLVCLALGAIPTAIGAPNQDVHLFEVRVVGTGTAFVDYGREGKDPTITTGAGVDGTESIGWRWETLAVADSVGNGPLIGKSEMARERAFVDADIVLWGVQMGEYAESSLCKRPGKHLFVSSNGTGIDPGRGSRGEYVGRGATLEVRGSGLIVKSLSYPSTKDCYHGIDGHGSKLFEGARARQAPIPAGEFNPRSDRSYKHTFENRRFTLGRGHDSGDPNQLHTFQGEAKIKVEIEAISERRFNRLYDKYGNKPIGKTEIYGP